MGIDFFGPTMRSTAPATCGCTAGERGIGSIASLAIAIMREGAFGDARVGHGVDGSGVEVDGSRGFVNYFRERHELPFRDDRIVAYDGEMFELGDTRYVE